MPVSEKHPIELLTDLLNAMTLRAIEAERQRDEAKAEASEWYGHYQTQKNRLIDTQRKLEEFIKKYGG